MFPGKQKLREFVANKHVLQRVQREPARMKWKKTKLVF